MTIKKAHFDAKGKLYFYFSYGPDSNRNTCTGFAGWDSMGSYFGDATWEFWEEVNLKCDGDRSFRRS